MRCLIIVSIRLMSVLLTTQLLTGCLSLPSDLQSQDKTPAATKSTAKQLNLEHLLGRWYSSDDAFGQAARSRLSWHKTLNNQFYQLHYKIERKNNDTYSPIFSGAALYKASSGDNYVATWADSNGEVLTIDATVNGGTLESIWRDAKRVKGKTHYTLIDDNTLFVKDWSLSKTGWQLFNEQQFTRDTTPPSRVTGIGGFFFRGKEPAELVRWYDHHFDITPTPSDYDTLPWQQEAGSTVFAPFTHTTKYFGEQSQQWMINLRVRDMDALVQQLRAADIEVELDPETYPNGRFARLSDPEGNPIQLWEPAGEEQAR